MLPLMHRLSAPRKRCADARPPEELAQGISPFGFDFVVLENVEVIGGSDRALEAGAVLPARPDALDRDAPNRRRRSITA